MGLTREIKICSLLTSSFEITTYPRLPNMPTTGGVVDAFKSMFPALPARWPRLSLRVPDLIRHGKNHSAKQHNDVGQYEYAAAQQQPPNEPQHAQQRQAREQPKVQQQHQTHKAASPKYREEVEQIVKEEREVKSKMPLYKGLENFKLIEKMGEYVASTA